MRSVTYFVVSLGLASVTLAGCATVSMYPTEVSLSKPISEEQTALRASADAFCETAEAEGWVAQAPGLVKIAQSLFDGKSPDADGSMSYADAINVSGSDVSLVSMTITADAQKASSALAGVNEEARALVQAGRSQAGRADVIRLERALVWAQKAHRAFADATDELSGRGGVDLRDVDAALNMLAVEIDETRALANALADLYSGTGADATT